MTASQLSAYFASHLDSSVVVVRLVIFDLGTIKTCSTALQCTTNIRKSANRTSSPTALSLRIATRRVKPLSSLALSIPGESNVHKRSHI